VRVVGVRKVKKLYFDNRCVEATLRDYIEYSYLEFDFIFRSGGTDDELRKRIYDILAKYIPFIYEYIRVKKLREVLRRNLTQARLNQCYIVPSLFAHPIVIGIGRTLIAFRLPKWIIHKMIYEDGIVDIVREWCEKDGK
jgi:hypothetical protein